MKEKKTIMLIAGAALLAALLLLTVVFAGGTTFSESSKASRESVTAIGTARAGQQQNRETETRARAIPSPAEACTNTAVNAVRAWSNGDATAEWFTDDATMPDPTAEKPDMSAKEYKAGLAAGSADSATCSVYTGGDRPWTVQLALADGKWKATWLGLPGTSSDQYQEEDTNAAQ